LPGASWRFTIREIMLLTAAVAAFLAWANLAYRRSRPYQRTSIPDRLNMRDIQAICAAIGHQTSSYSSGGGGSSDRHSTTRTFECHLDLPANLQPQFMTKYREHLRSVLQEHAGSLTGGGMTRNNAGIQGFEIDYSQGRTQGTVIVRSAGRDGDLYLVMFVQEFQAPP
jgi:hypothetical protein